MAEFLLSPGLRLVLFAGAVIFTALALGRDKLLWAVLGAVCVVGLCLLGLAAGQTLEELLTAVLVPAAMVLHALGSRKGGGEP